MKDSVVVSIEFYYQGECYQPTAELDLDALMQTHGSLPDLVTMLARFNDIGDYSYQLEVMMMEPLHFSQASGLVVDYINDGVLDIAAYEAAWHEQAVATLVADIARRVMHLDSLDQQPDLKRALLEAYHLGRNSMVED